VFLCGGSWFTFPWLFVLYQVVVVLFVGIISAVYQGLLDLHHILHSPFGEKVLDVNHEGILYQGLGKTIDFMLGDPPVSVQ